MQALVNPTLKTNMSMIFGEEDTEAISSKLKLTPKSNKYKLILNVLKTSLKSIGCRYCIDFAFKSNHRCSHVLLLASKDPKAYEIMKDIMAKFSRKSHDNIASFDHDKCVGHYLINPRGSFNSLCNEIPKLLTKGEKTVYEIFANDNVDKPYTLKNYKDALISLEQNNIVSVKRPSLKSPKKSMAPNCITTLQKE
jgi:hypothetical protein